MVPAEGPGLRRCWPGPGAGDGTTMDLPMRFVCSECGRSVSWEVVSGHDDLHPCAVCRGEGDVGPGGDGPSTTRTPGSLELTPENLAARTSTCDYERGLPASIGRFLVRD